MRRVFRMVGAMTLLSFVFVGSFGMALAAPRWNKDNGRYEHIFVIMMENHSTDQILGIPPTLPLSINWRARQRSQPTTSV